MSVALLRLGRSWIRAPDRAVRTVRLSIGSERYSETLDGSIAHARTSRTLTYAAI